MEIEPRFCTLCAAPLVSRPTGNGREVPACPACGTIHWRDPKLAAGCLVIEKGRVLLARRAIEPGYGLWVFPGGHVDRGETVEDAAIRETREECGILVELEDLVGLFSFTGRPVVVAVFRARLVPGSPRPVAADETLEIGWFDADGVESLPLAFRSTAEALGRLFGRSYSVHPCP